MLGQGQGLGNDGASSGPTRAADVTCEFHKHLNCSVNVANFTNWNAKNLYWYLDRGNTPTDLSTHHSAAHRES